MQYLIYSTTQFSLNGGDLEAAYNFLKAINGDALRSIRTINLHWCAYNPVYRNGRAAQRWGIPINTIPDEQKWEAIWQIIPTCTDLQNLYIKIFDEGYVLYEDSLLKPLQKVQTNTFIVQLPWPWGFQSWAKQEADGNYRGVSGEGCNFQVIRPDDRDGMIVRAAPIDALCTRGGWRFL
jgi:hypothetical protein